MSRENVELVAGLQPAPDVDIAALMRDEAASRAMGETVASLFHPGLETVADTGVGWGTYQGLDGLRTLWLDWTEPWESYRTETEEITDCGDRVLVLVRDYGRRHGMESEVCMHGAAVWTVADGKILRVVFYSSRAEALEAVGLRE